MAELKLIDFGVNEDLSKCLDSMLFDSDTNIASAEFQYGNRTIELFLDVRGEVSVDYNGSTYEHASEFPKELVEFFTKACWDYDDPDIYVRYNNWFEVIYFIDGESVDGDMFEDDLSGYTEEKLKEYFTEFAQSLIDDGYLDD